MAAPLLVVDAPSILYRAFFALPKTIKGADGEPVNALLGTANLVLREVAEHEPRAVVLCFGAEAADYRVELYAGYHADRPEMPELLEPQWAASRDFFTSFGWQVAEHETLEADDLLGSFAAAETGGRRADADHDRRPRHVPVRRARTSPSSMPAPASAAPSRSDPPRSGRATASIPGRSPISSPCAATPPTASPAPRGSVRRPPPTCCAATARSTASSSTRSSRAPRGSAASSATIASSCSPTGRWPGSRTPGSAGHPIPRPTGGRPPTPPRGSA